MSDYAFKAVRSVVYQNIQLMLELLGPILVKPGLVCDYADMPQFRGGNPYFP